MKEQESYKLQELEFYKQLKKEFNDLLEQIKSGEFLDNKLTVGGIECGYGDTDQNLHDEQIILLAEALKKSPNITIVNLYGHNIRDEGAIALASVTSIEELDLSANPIGAEGVKALANGNFKKLYLSSNSVNYYEEKHQQFVEMTNALITNKTIIDLNLESSYIPSEMIAQLIKNNTTIKTLILGIGIIDEAFKFIGENKTLEGLHVPEEITDIGAEYIASNTSLKEIGIAKSKITDIGAKLLSTHPTLKELYICDSDITIEGAKCFLDSNLETLTLRTILKQDVISNEECEYFNYTFEEAKKLKFTLVEENHNNIDDEKELGGNIDHHEDEL